MVCRGHIPKELHSERYVAQGRPQGKHYMHNANKVHILLAFWPCWPAVGPNGICFGSSRLHVPGGPQCLPSVNRLQCQLSNYHCPWVSYPQGTVVVQSLDWHCVREFRGLHPLQLCCGRALEQVWVKVGSRRGLRTTLGKGQVCDSQREMHAGKILLYLYVWTQGVKNAS